MSVTLTFVRPITKFKLYISLTGLTHGEVAKAIGVSNNQIDRISIGRGVGHATSNALEKATGGFLLARELYGDPVVGDQGARQTAKMRVWEVFVAPSCDLVSKVSSSSQD